MRVIGDKLNIARAARIQCCDGRDGFRYLNGKATREVRNRQFDSLTWRGTPAAIGATVPFPAQVVCYVINN